MRREASELIALQWMPDIGSKYGQELQHDRKGHKTGTGRQGRAKQCKAGQDRAERKDGRTERRIWDMLMKSSRLYERTVWGATEQPEIR